MVIKMKIICIHHAQTKFILILNSSNICIIVWSFIHYHFSYREANTENDNLFFQHYVLEQQQIQDG